METRRTRQILRSVSLQEDIPKDYPYLQYILFRRIAIYFVVFSIVVVARACLLVTFFGVQYALAEVVAVQTLSKLNESLSRAHPSH